MKNKIKIKLKKAPDFSEYAARQLKNPKVKGFYDDYGKKLEVAYQILQMRKKAGISQTELAEKIGAKQNNVARIEAGQQNLTMDTLQKIAFVFKKDLKIEFAKSDWK